MGGRDLRQEQQTKKSRDPEEQDAGREVGREVAQDPARGAAQTPLTRAARSPLGPPAYWVVA
ncbi:MAG: hypothetical protein Kow00122_03120 [Thermoleophilia bacterium]